MSKLPKYTVAVIINAIIFSTIITNGAYYINTQIAKNAENKKTREIKKQRTH